MTFRVTVHHVADREFLSSPPPIDDDDDSFEHWHQQAEQLFLLDEFVGFDVDIERYWSRPSASLGLPLLAWLHQHGVDVEGDDLETLRHEVDRLELHWSATLDSDVVQRLHDCAATLRSAIQVAIAEQGYLQIG